MIENTEPDFWKPDNLVTCVCTCLRMIQKLARNGMCPNYFIPDENLFETLSTDVKQTLDNELEKILSTDFKNVLERLKAFELQNVSYSYSDLQKEKTLGFMRLYPALKLATRICDMYFSRNLIFKIHCNRNLELCLNNLIKLDQVKESLAVKCQTEQEIKSALALIFPLIKPTLLAHKVALGIQQCKSKQDIWKILTSAEWMQSNGNTDSSRLKHASVLHTLGYFSNSLEVLAPLNNVSKISCCNCDANMSYCPLKDTYILSMLIRVYERPNTTEKDILTDIVTPCIVFLPTEQDVTPVAINYEMLRSVGTHLQENPFLPFWVGWSVVDGRFLFHFLLYLNHSKLHQSYNAKDDIKNMEHIINAVNVTHPETCLNLLGWVYKEQGHIDKAVECFRRSMKVQPFYNAAVWHICMLICETLSRID